MAVKKATSKKKTSKSKAKKPAPKSKAAPVKETVKEEVAAPAEKKPATKTEKKPAKTTKSGLKPDTYQRKLKKLKAGDYETQENALFEALLALEFKVRAEMSDFRKESMIQEVTTGSGDTMKRANPAVQEFRALVKDYATLCKVAKEFCGAKKTEESSSKLKDLRSLIKVV